MNTSRVMIVSLVTLAAALGFGLSLEEPVAGRGAAHPTHTTMNHGGDSSRHDARLTIGWIYAAAQIVFAVCGLSLGLKTEQSWTLWALGGFYLAVFSLMFSVYRFEPSHSKIVFGFSQPTAMVVYGIWPAGLVFVVAYVVFFREWVFDENDRVKFDQILAQHRQRSDG